MRRRDHRFTGRAKRVGRGRWEDRRDCSRQTSPGKDDVVQLGGERVARFGHSEGESVQARSRLSVRPVVGPQRVRAHRDVFGDARCRGAGLREVFPAPGLRAAGFSTWTLKPHCPVAQPPTMLGAPPPSPNCTVEPSSGRVAKAVHVPADQVAADLHGIGIGHGVIDDAGAPAHLVSERAKPARLQPVDGEIPAHGGVFKVAVDRSIR